MKQALHHWRAQRITAVILVPLCLWFILTLAVMMNMDYASVTAWIKSPLTSLLLILFIFALFEHAHLGLQVILEDYIGSAGRRNCAIFMTRIAILGAGLISALSVLKITLRL